MALDGIPEVRIGDDLGAPHRRRHRADGRRPAADTTTTSWSSPRRSCRRPRAPIIDLTARRPRRRGDRVRRALRPRRRARSRSSSTRPPGRPDGERRPDHRDAARVRVRQRRRRRVERRARFGLARDAPAARSGRLGRPASALPSGPASAWTCRSSCPTRSAGRGAGASSTSRSACPGCCRSRTCAACPTPTAGSCARPSGPSPTSWPRPPSSPSARPPAGPWRSSAAPTFTRGEGSIRELDHARRERPVPLEDLRQERLRPLVLRVRRRSARATLPR